MGIVIDFQMITVFALSRSRVLQWVPAIKKAEILGEASVSYSVEQKAQFHSFLAGELCQNPSVFWGSGGKLRKCIYVMARY
jgi:hypothetical protein